MPRLRSRPAAGGRKPRPAPKKGRAAVLPEGSLRRGRLVRPLALVAVPRIARHTRQIRPDHPARAPGNAARSAGDLQRGARTRFLEVRPRRLRRRRRRLRSGPQGGGGTGGGGAGGRQRVGMSIPLKNYDLMPWASVVIDRLQVAWVLPAVPEIPDPARIGMIVVIKKTGELDSIEILEGTTVEALDRAALDAIRAALPFPALPGDFPGDLLEIIFEFVYND
ncbi:MAG: TonB C-terminal domain-containing protein [Candidatus Moduliflexus flocculans]|nr:TonB C-terminal domain-containing protein [Candidatus Moduliflexus flocculans]